MEHLVFTIARHYGSGGNTIGHMLAQNLGIPCYERVILRLASDDSGINERLFNEADEKLRSNPIFKRRGTNVYKGELIPPGSDDFVSNDNLFYYQAKVMKDLAQSQSCVMVGHCADFVLKEYPNVVRVFIHAPWDYCVARCMEKNDIDEREAEKYIEKVNKYFGDYYYYYTGNYWNDARNYDLCLDSSKMSWDECVEEIKAYTKIRFREEL